MNLQRETWNFALGGSPFTLYGFEANINHMCSCLRRLAGLILLSCSAANLWAGGSGLNVVVVVNQNSTNSVQLGNYYCEKRAVPPQNLLRINWTNSNTLTWTLSDYETSLLNPLVSMLSCRQLTNQIDYIVLSMDIPYQITTSDEGVVSTTSALFYGFQPDPNPPCSLPTNTTSLYAGSEGIFRQTPPICPGSNSWLVTMITSSNLPMAQAIVDQGVNSDGAFPTQTVYLAKSDDVARNVRYVTFDNAIFNTRLRGNYSMQRINADTISDLGNILGAQTGLINYNIYGVSVAPGGMVDNLTSYGGLILTDSGGQLSILGFTTAGAAGTYGTVTEPCNYLQKFPSPQNYFYQARGFSLAECFYQSVTNPYQGLIIGEPLAAPFAQPASGSWSNLPPNAILSGTTNLLLQFTASDARHPVQQVDLFLDGAFLQTLTNIPPGANNVLFVTINGAATNYTVPANANLLSVASNLTAVLNSSYTNATHVSASANGDRIELHSFDINTPGSQIPISVSNSIGAALALTTFISASLTNFLDTIAFGIQNYVITNQVQNGDFLQLTVTKTNGSTVSITVTNPPGNTTTSDLVSNLMNSINANASLTGADGVTAEDFIPYDVWIDPTFEGAEFNLLPNSPGWPESQLQIVLSGSTNLVITPVRTNQNHLDQNVSDLQPRNHLYLTAGVTNLPLAFAFDSTAQSDGFHELTAVAYEGSHVRTQAHAVQDVCIQNTPLTAAFATLVGGTNTAVEATLQFSVTANTNNVALIELFGTGGLLGCVSNQSSAVFSVPGASLNIGLQPFYAIVICTNGMSYRTATKWYRLVGPDSPFPLNITAPAPTISWSAAAGRSYTILFATNITDTFQTLTSVTPTNSAGQWTETNNAPPRRFYRLSASP
jgi:uncharacterized protein (TIGR03790 family)